MIKEVFQKILAIKDPVELAKYGYQLQEFVNEAPCCAIAHKLLFRAMCGIGGEAYMSHLEKTSLYVYSRSELFFLLNNFRNAGVNTSASFEETRPAEMAPVEVASTETSSTEQEKNVAAIQENEVAAEQQQPKSEQKKVYVVGGDYFNKEDYLSVQTSETRNISERLKLQEDNEQDTEIESVTQQANIVDDDNFVTETLAGIYAKQGYFKLAIKCYEKLILLYPKKSAYFAALIGDIKKKTNN